MEMALPEERLSQKMGYTLLELMITIGVIAIIISVSIPYIIGNRPLRALKGAVSDIQSELMLARMKTVSQYTPLEVLFTFDDSTDPDGKNRDSYMTQTIAGNPVGPKKFLPAGVDIDHINPGGITSGQVGIEFNVDGSAESASIFLKNIRGDRYKITIVPNTGRIKSGRGWDW
jgi:prepilin-type N-terminal cleavage/methylation domain-containing protein